jgi:hypothetical protein
MLQITIYFFHLKHFPFAGEKRNIVDQDELVILLSSFTSFSAITLPFDAFYFQAFKLLRIYK